VITTEPEILGPEIDVFDDQAETINSDINGLLTSIKNHELSLATSYARLGRLLLRVQQERYWEGWGFGSFGQYIDSIREIIDRGRAQVYAAISVVGRLLPSITEQQLDKMGISRAQELSRFVKQSGRKVPPYLLDMALDSGTKISKLHSEVLIALNEHGEVKGDWFEFGGFFATAEEKLEINQAVQLAEKDVDGEAPDHQRRKEVFLSFVREFYSSNVQEG